MKIKHFNVERTKLRTWRWGDWAEKGAGRVLSLSPHSSTVWNSFCFSDLQTSAQWQLLTQKNTVSKRFGGVQVWAGSQQWGPAWRWGCWTVGMLTPALEERTGRLSNRQNSEETSVLQVASLQGSCVGAIHWLGWFEGIFGVSFIFDQTSEVLVLALFINVTISDILIRLKTLFCF